MSFARAPLALRRVYCSTSLPSGSFPNEFFSTLSPFPGSPLSAFNPPGTKIKARNASNATQRNSVVPFIGFDLLDRRFQRLEDYYVRIVMRTRSDAPCASPRRCAQCSRDRRTEASRQAHGGFFPNWPPEPQDRPGGAAIHGPESRDR